MINEIKEQSLRELQDIPLSTEDLIGETVKDYSEQVNQITSGFNNGFTKLNEALADTYETQFNVWVGDVTQGTLKGMKHISRSINQLKNTLSDGLRDVKKYFNSTFEEISSLFKKNITEYINRRVEGQKELKTEISQILNSAIEESKITIDNQINSKTTPFEGKVQELLDALESTSNLNSQISTSIMELNNLTSDKDDEIKNLMKSISENLEKVIIPFNTQIDGKFEEIDTELKPVKDSYSEIRILLEKLQKTMTEFRNLT
jgi:uncharacterized protein YqgV (UPF0045/DUF77 family)